MPWYFYHALKQLFPSGRFFSFFTFMSIVGVMLGVCVLIIVQSVMNGFGEGIRSKIVETYGDVRIKSNELIYNWETDFEVLRSMPEVKAIAPYAEGVIMLQFENRPEFPGIRGIDPLEEEGVIPIRDFITLGDFDDFDDEGVFLGEGLAYALKVRPGDRVEVFTPLMLEALKEDEVLLPREFEVLGVYRTSSPTVDSNSMICTLRVMQELYGMGDGVHGIVIKLKPGVDADLFSMKLEEEALRPELRAVSWRQSSRDFLFVIEQEKRVISFIIIFIILVASFSIAISLMMAVLRKTREIGLLVAMGARPREVAYSYCLQGLVIGFVGTVFGVLIALIALHNRGPIIQFYLKVTSFMRSVVAEQMIVEFVILAFSFLLLLVLAVLFLLRLRDGFDGNEGGSRTFWQVALKDRSTQIMLFSGVGCVLVAGFFVQGFVDSTFKMSYAQLSFLGVYDVYEIPIHYLKSDFIIVTIFAIVISTLAGLLPALRAARLKPADALRSE